MDITVITFSITSSVAYLKFDKILNFKNLSNSCYHFEDHQLPTKWHVFATSHGKCSCDGVGGVVKRLVAHASLQLPVNDQLLSISDMYHWSKDHIQGIQFFLVNQESVLQNCVKFGLLEYFKKCKTVAGIRSHHSFIPHSTNKMYMRRLSDDDVYTVVTVGSSSESDATAAQIGSSDSNDNYQPGKYVACVYDYEWYVGNIKDRSDEHSDVLMSFMKKSRNELISWSARSRKDESWIPFKHTFCLISAPTVQGSSSRHYVLSEGDLNIN
ncbi:uncharacterized protein LOC143236365 [Tachypleus tridentatus]|uniref:uncharacterized protein LOC143236365 n=1 Tax=Tachypleus tridentatus TaxID=6853 RepID=UPI003FD4962A